MAKRQSRRAVSEMHTRCAHERWHGSASRLTMILGPIQDGRSDLVGALGGPVAGLHRAGRKALLLQVLGSLSTLELADAIHAKVAGKADGGVLRRRRRRRASGEVIHRDVAARAVRANGGRSTTTHVLPDEQKAKRCSARHVSRRPQGTPCVNPIHRATWSRVVDGLLAVWALQRLRSRDFERVGVLTFGRVRGEG